MFKLEVKDIIDNEIKVLETKTVYNLDNGDSIPGWLGGNARSCDWEPTLKFSSGINISHNGREGKRAKGALGTFSHKGSTVEYNQTMVLLMTGRFSDDGTKTTQIFPDNLMQTCNLFSARKLIQSDWINQKDGYMTPNEKHEDYAEYSYDALIFSLFNTSSLQNSIKEGEQKVNNEFFFLDINKVKDLADKEDNIECYKSIRHDKQRFLARVIDLIENGKQDCCFSEKAQKVLDLARELVILSFPYRQSFNLLKPEYQINNWDCGWYQIKGLLNWIVENNKDEDIKEKYDEFKEAYKELGDKMRPMVYELGFLKK